MLSKIKQSKYLFLGRYFLLGIILGVFSYQFITQSVINQRIDLGMLFDKESMKLLVACLFGSVIGGIVYIIISVNDKTRERREANNWLKMKDAKISTVMLKVMFALSLGAFVGMIVKKGLGIESYESFMHTLFSNENIISYVGAVMAACVFAIPLSIGAMKRLKLLYDK